jgi:MFS family permease
MDRPLFLGGALVFTGYSLVRAFFLGYIPIRPGPTADPSTAGMALLCFSMFLSGCGGAAGLTAAVNAVAKSFSDKTRATASGMVLAGFGLSAFTFSTIGHGLFSGDAGGLLLLLALGCSAPMLLGSLVIKEVSPKVESGYERIADGPEIIFDDGHDEMYHTRSSSIELSRSRSPAPVSRHPRHHVTAAPKRKVSSIPPAIDFSPMQLIYNVDFYALCAVLAICCGTGLMYINNVGTVALALGRNGQLEYNAHDISAWQAKQVATISIYNCAGRVLAGLASDWAKARFGIGRIWFLPVVAAMFIISQFTAIGTEQVEHLWIVSTMLGFAYGSLFNVIPILVLEWFGMAHFSQNFGTINLAPILGGNLFNLLFGYVYDSNTIGRIGMPETEKLGDAVAMLARGGGTISNDDQHACLIGEACYGAAFKMTTFGCFVALAISLAAGFKRAKDAAKLSGVGRGAEV